MRIDRCHEWCEKSVAEAAVKEKGGEDTVDVPAAVQADRGLASLRAPSTIRPSRASHSREDWRSDRKLAIAPGSETCGTECPLLSQVPFSRGAGDRREGA
jgi:hypothetical protein